MNSDSFPKRDWRKTLLRKSAAIKEAIRSLDESAMRIVLVVDSDLRLLGTVSDGDIRRGLLKGLDLESPISGIIHKNPLVVTPGLQRHLVLELMTANKIQQIPVVNEEARLVGLHLWDEVSSIPDRENIMVVMAGGLGRRLRPFTENCPKPMIPVGGKPMLEYIIERAKGEGFNRFVFAVHYLGKMIEDHFGAGERFGVRIDYLREKKALGTAGALSLLDPPPNASFVVTNGDVLADIRYGDLVDFHIRHQATATMAVRLHELRHPFGVVHIKGLEIVGFDEKPVHRSHINGGVYALSPQSLTALKKEEPCDMPTLFQRLQNASERIIAFPMHEPWLDVGDPENLEQARKEKTESKK